MGYTYITHQARNVDDDDDALRVFLRKFVTPIEAAKAIRSVHGGKAYHG